MKEEECLPGERRIARMRSCQQLVGERRGRDGNRGVAAGADEEEWRRRNVCHV